MSQIGKHRNYISKKKKKKDINGYTNVLLEKKNLKNQQ